jgi:hypothetical protein
MRLFLSGLCLISGLALMAGCRKTQDAPPPPPGPSSGISSLPADTANVMRESLSVSLPCGNGRIEFKDTSYTRSEGGSSYRLLDTVFQDSGWFVERFGWEEYQVYFFPKRECAPLPVGGAPVFNPSRSAFATVEASPYDGDATARIAAWKGGKAGIVWHRSWTGWESPERVAWTDDSDLVLGLSHPDRGRSQATARMRAGIWSWDSSGAGTGASLPADTARPPYPEAEADSSGN